MRWSEHPTTARHELKCQELCAALRSSGYGVYWMIMEAIGEYSNSLHLKVSGISAEIDTCYRELLMKSGGGLMFSGTRDVTYMVPELSHRVLARQCFMNEEELLGVIEKCVAVGLFHEQKWMTYHILYSDELEARAAYYTRRLTRSLEIPSAHSAPRSPGQETISRPVGEARGELPRVPGPSPAVEAGEDPAGVSSAEKNTAAGSSQEERSDGSPEEGLEAGGETAGREGFRVTEGACGALDAKGSLSDEGIRKFHESLRMTVAKLNERHGTSFKLEITFEELRALRSGFPGTAMRLRGEKGWRWPSWIYPREAQIVVAVATLTSENCPKDKQFQWLQTFIYNAFRTGFFSYGPLPDGTDRSGRQSYEDVGSPGLRGSLKPGSPD